MNNMHHKTIMEAEVKADCYSGENCDEVRKYFEMYCSGDMDSDRSTDDITIALKDLPPGAKVTVEYPCCPDCGQERFDNLVFAGGGCMEIRGHESECDCGFDWEQWVLERYS